MKDYQAFQFKQFSVSHSESGMKIGTDAVLLGAWADLSECRRILDVGTGSGILALMAAQRNDKAQIDAVELDVAAVKEACGNVDNSPWPLRINVINCDFKNFSSLEKYDYIISNPPFFETGARAPEQKRAMARHTDSLSFEEFFKCCKKLLANRGLIGIIAPAEARRKIEFLAGETDLWLQRRVGVRATYKKPIKRYLWEFANTPSELTEGELVLNDGLDRSAYFHSLTKEFYIR